MGGELPTGEVTYNPPDTCRLPGNYPLHRIPLLPPTVRRLTTPCEEAVNARRTTPVTARPGPARPADTCV